MTLRVAALTGGMHVPSARFRVRQYRGHTDLCGVSLDEYAARVASYPPPKRWLRPFWLAAALMERSARAVSLRGYDAILFQRELISTIVTLEPLFARPRVLDVDDAIWMHRGGKCARRLARICDAIVCGNETLADYFVDFTPQVYVLPTAVDVARFVPGRTGGAGRPVIGWSGTSGNLRELIAIEPALKEVLHRFPDVKLRVICDRPPRFASIAPSSVEYVRWRADIEVAVLQDLVTGLMPLEDTPWNRGKCAAKMLTYLSCAVPVVASPVGVNREILKQAPVGYGATDLSDWVEGISALLADRDRAVRMGRTGRRVVERRFSVQALAPKLAQIIKCAVGAGGASADGTSVRDSV